LDTGNPADNDHTTFFHVLPTPRIYARTPFYNLMNSEDLFAQFRIRPHARVSLRTDARRLRAWGPAAECDIISARTLREGG
jgi:hypothetical protein